MLHIFIDLSELQDTNNLSSGEIQIEEILSKCIEIINKLLYYFT